MAPVIAQSSGGRTQVAGAAGTIVGTGATIGPGWTGRLGRAGTGVSGRVRPGMVGSGLMHLTMTHGGMVMPGRTGPVPVPGVTPVPLPVPVPVEPLPLPVPVEPLPLPVPVLLPAGAGVGTEGAVGAFDPAGAGAGAVLLLEEGAGSGAVVSVFGGTLA